jgi:hypothetical protein
MNPMSMVIYPTRDLSDENVWKSSSSRGGRIAAVSKDDFPAIFPASWFETAQARLLTMRSRV